MSSRRVNTEWVYWSVGILFILGSFYSFARVADAAPVPKVKPVACTSCDCSWVYAYKTFTNPAPGQVVVDGFFSFVKQVGNSYEECDNGIDGFSVCGGSLTNVDDSLFVYQWALGDTRCTAATDPVQGDVTQGQTRKVIAWKLD